MQFNDSTFETKSVTNSRVHCIFKRKPVRDMPKPFMQIIRITVDIFFYNRQKFTSNSYPVQEREGGNLKLIGLVTRSLICSDY